MGLSDIKTGISSLWQKRKSKTAPDPVVRWFGKLPTYGDYYESAGGAEWEKELREWSLRGRELFRVRSKALLGDKSQTGKIVDAEDEEETIHLTGRIDDCDAVLRLPKSGMTAFVTLRDYGGDMVGRPFPLMFYVAIPTESWPGPDCGMVSGMEQVFEPLRSLWGEVAQFLRGPGNFDSTFRGRKIDVASIVENKSNGDWTRGAMGLSVGDWFDAARHSMKTREPVAWFEMISRWGEQIRQHDENDHGLSLRLPLAARTDEMIQLAGWLRWLEQRMDLSKRACSLLLTRNDVSAPSKLTLLARDIEVDDFLLMTPLSAKLDYLDDITMAEPHNDVPSESKGGWSAMQTWADFVGA